MSINTTYSTPVFKKDQPGDSYKFQPLPAPSGPYPYRLSLTSIQPDNSNEQMSFHLVGDTGSLRGKEFIWQIANEMAAQYIHSEHQSTRPDFLYHLGDVVYNYGEACEYPEQFFKPYQNYPGPIFAIAGNHDSDVNPDAKFPYHSLDAFTRVFCAPEAMPIPFSGEIKRNSMTQPHVYWTLDTPLAIIIGLHSNVTKYGMVTAEQRAWFIDELKAAQLQRPGKALIVTVHHAPYSADSNHGSSHVMIDLLEGAIAETGVRPDIVFSGHVHNYQRFIKHYPDGTSVPFVVAGAGGYDELHPIALTNDARFTGTDDLLQGIKLQHYCDTGHGFLKITLKKSHTGLNLCGEYYLMNRENTAAVNDSFVLTI